MPPSLGKVAARTGATRKRVKAICARFHLVYHEQDLGNVPDPIDELVYISLTRQTHAKNAMRTWNTVKALGGPPALFEMPLEKLEEMLVVGGLFRQKARWLKDALAEIKVRFGSLSLASTAQWTDQDVERFLTSLPGVSIKAAKCIMLYSMGRQVLPVDTHTRRLAARAGLVPEGLSEKAIHQALEDQIPPGHRYAFHVNSIWHGRKVCRAQNPKCHECTIREYCDFGCRVAGGV